MGKDMFLSLLSENLTNSILKKDNTIYCPENKGPINIYVTFDTIFKILNQLTIVDFIRILSYIISNEVPDDYPNFELFDETTNFKQYYNDLPQDCKKYINTNPEIRKLF